MREIHLPSEVPLCHRSLVEEEIWLKLIPSANLLYFETDIEVEMIIRPSFNLMVDI
jgi:hypothetical protein